MTGCDDLVQVQRICLGDGAQIVGAICDIFKRARITAVAIANAVVFIAAGVLRLRERNAVPDPVNP